MTPYASATVKPLTPGQLNGAVAVLTARLVVEDGDEVVDDEDTPPVELDQLVVDGRDDAADEDQLDDTLEVTAAMELDTLLEAHDDELVALELVEVVDGTVHTRLTDVGSGLPLS